MALIVCNECGSQISDKAISCPICGNPLSEAFIPKGVCQINGLDYDLRIPEQQIKNGEILKALLSIYESTGFDMNTSDTILTAIQDNNNEVPAKLDIEVKMSVAPKCPTCGSTNLTKISAATRAFDRAFFGRHSPESKAQFRCNKCGYLW